jgi:peptidoglycan/LPS O-acetylase OafA/YrhL
MTLFLLPEHSVKYRPDVDGLRAVAVLPVVVYHLGLPLHGGYVGVDIFFTISGFLIGSIILRQTAEGKFTFHGFYERRIRRIFPALIAVLLVSTLLAYRYMLPTELVDYSRSLVAAAFSCSNFYFWQQSGYFDAPAYSKPLLHTWSLAVEEQFYIFLPVLLVMLRRFTPRFVDLSIYLIAAISLGASIYGAYHDPTTTFYLTHTRMWELLCGTILALDSCPKIRRVWARHAFGILGMALIGVSVWYYRTSTPFPGLAALLPCLGAALIILAGCEGTNIVGRILSLRPIVFIGLISYSLYLWHWPVIVFHSLGLSFVNGLSRHQYQALLFVISLVMAVLSWRFIELPFRAGALRMERRLLFRGAAAAVLIVAGISVTTIAMRGADWRFSSQAREVAAYLEGDPHDRRNQYRDGTCFITTTDTFNDFAKNECMPDKPGEKQFLLLGDSHAAAMWWGLNQVLQGANVMQATASGCKPVLHQRPRQYATCIAVMDYALEQYLPTHHVDAVLIEAHWDDGDLSSLGETMEWLGKQHIPVILFGPIVQYDSSLPRLLAMSISHSDPQLPSAHRLLAIEPLDREMAALAGGTWNVPYVSMFDLFCGKSGCTEYAAPDVPLQSDYGHLTKAGSVLAGQRIAALGVLPLHLKSD